MNHDEVKRHALGNPGLPRAVRLNVFLAHANVASRRQADQLIASGQVQVNGQIVKTLGTKVDPRHDKIQVNGKSVAAAPAAFEYYLLYKPRGVLSTTADDRGRKTVRQLVPSSQRLYPVGRLDRDSEGILILTNDGDLTHRITHPSFHVAKTYDVWVRGLVTPTVLEKWRQGGQIVDEKAVRPMQVMMKRQDGHTTYLQVVLHEGRKRQIREVARHFRLTVVRLIRTAFGPLTLGTLQPGQWRTLTPREVTGLRQASAPRTIEHGSTRSAKSNSSTWSQSSR